MGLADILALLAIGSFFLALIEYDKGKGVPAGLLFCSLILLV